MRRTHRVLRNPAIVVSFVLCSAILALWVRSARTVDVLIWGGPSQDSSRPNAVIVLDGAVLFVQLWPGSRTPEHHSGPTILRGRENLHLAESKAPNWLRPGRLAHTGLAVAGVEGGAGGWTVPFWLFGVASAVLPAIPATIALLRRRWLAGRCTTGSLCPACGYDLRATPERCPECGTATAR